MQGRESRWQKNGCKEMEELEDYTESAAEAEESVVFFIMAPGMIKLVVGPYAISGDSRSSRDSS